jgi:glycosyltransferase involved in cell wall biosynthesis
MRILFVSTYLTRSATGLMNAMMGLGKGLASQDMEVMVAGGADKYFDEDRALWEPLEIFPAPNKGSNYGLHARMFSILRHCRPDLVHVHGIWSATTIYGLTASLSGIPTVVSPHGMLDPWIVARRPLVKRAHAALFERPLMHRAHIHALNEAEREAVGAFIPSAAPRTFVVPNGVPDAKISRNAIGRTGALFIGRLHEKKQVLELVRAWRQLNLPHDARLTIAGWGDPTYEAAVRQAVDGATNVEFVGPLHGAAKTAALSNARFFILPSLSEGLPMAVLEAIQHGCIPILTAQCNLPELVRDDIALPMGRDFGDFREVMAQAFDLSGEEAARRSAAASAYAANYAWPKIADAMIEQYRRCIAGDPHS